MRAYKITVADPAKNITVFVSGGADSQAERREIVKKIMADPSLKAEQVGFVIPPPADTANAVDAADDTAAVSRKPWRLEMMGGEFCGNAARAFGLFVARKLAVFGKLTIPIEISGAREPLSVRMDTFAGTAEVQMPLPLPASANHDFPPGSIAYNGARLPLVVFEGITHVIAPDIAPGRQAFFEIKKSIDAPQKSPGALGVMFWDSAAGFMSPAVYVYAAGSLVFESSCGSGSAAMAVWQNRGLDSGEASAQIVQPGGIITTRVVKHRGEILSLSIGGEVSLGEEQTVFF